MNRAIHSCSLAVSRTKNALASFNHCLRYGCSTLTSFLHNSIFSLCKAGMRSTSAVLCIQTQLTCQWNTEVMYMPLPWCFNQGFSTCVPPSLTVKIIGCALECRYFYQMCYYTGRSPTDSLKHEVTKRFHSQVIVGCPGLWLSPSLCVRNHMTWRSVKTFRLFRG